MAGKLKYKKDYANDVITLSLLKMKVSNNFIAKWLRVDEKTIRNWRKQYSEFDNAFHEALTMIKEKILKTARKNLDVRKRRIIKKTPDGETITTEEILPSHKDILIYANLGLKQIIFDFEKQRQKEYLQKILERKNAGELTALQAAQFIEIEGVKVPATLILEIKQSINTFKPDHIPPNLIEITRDMQPQEAADAYKKLMG